MNGTTVKDFAELGNIVSSVVKVSVSHTDSGVTFYFDEDASKKLMSLHSGRWDFSVDVYGVLALRPGGQRRLSNYINNGTQMCFSGGMKGPKFAKVEVETVTVRGNSLFVELPSELPAYHRRKYDSEPEVNMVTLEALREALAQVNKGASAIGAELYVADGEVKARLEL
jgi:hypothetical protein